MEKGKVLELGLGLVLLLSLPSVSIAQQGSSPSPKSAGPSGASQQSAASSKGNVDAPEDDASLNLTDDQKTEIKSIRADSKQQMVAMDKDTSLSDEQKQRKAKQIKMATRKQVWGVLTPEQQKAWAEETRERREAKHQTGKPQQ
jgi:hypothetical protein